VTAPDRGISVVLPTYGRAAWCVEAARSALAQEGVDVEVLVAVDGPQPDTEAALASLADARLRVLVAPHGGRSAARNRALAAATKAHVAFLDDDDRYLPGALRTLLDALARHPDAVLASPWRRGLPGRRKASRGRETCRDRLREQCLGRMPLNVTVAFPRRLLERVPGFDEDVAIGEDWLFLLRAAEVGPFVDVPVPVVATRRHPGQTRHDPRTGRPPRGGCRATSTTCDAAATTFASPELASAATVVGTRRVRGTGGGPPDPRLLRIRRLQASPRPHPWGP
jgi:glycosyltransferase involved in cell wall biosynthesis